MSEVGDVVAPIMLTTGMIIGVRTMDQVSRKASKRRTKKKSPSASYYCRKCKIRHRNKSKIGKSHKRRKK